MRLTNVLLALGFTAAVTLAPATTETVELTQCDVFRPGHGGTQTVQLMCGGVPGKVAGGAVAVAKPSAQLPKATYGRLKDGTPTKTKLTERKMRKFIRAQKVPLPAKNSKRATTDFDSYGVYHIYNSKTGQAFKFGITKRGHVRPKAQMKACKKHFNGTDCTFIWVRKDVKGFYKARNIEAHHAARYKKKHGQCPDGMKACK